MTMHKIGEIDPFDEKILRALQTDARKTSIELAEIVGLSPSSCQRRQRDLEQRGVIRGYRADIDPAVLGQSFTVFAAVQLERHVRSDVQAFQKAVTQLPGILEVHHIAGAFDYLLRIAVCGPGELRDLPRRSFDGAARRRAHHFVRCDVDAKVKAVAPRRYAWGAPARDRRRGSALRPQKNAPLTIQ